MSTRKHWRGPPRWPRAPGPDPSTPMPYETIRNVYEYVEQRVPRGSGPAGAPRSSFGGRRPHRNQRMSSASPDESVFVDTEISKTAPSQALSDPSCSFARTWLNELKGRNIRVNVLSPGGRSTHWIPSDSRRRRVRCSNPRSPRGERWVVLRKFATVALFLASDEASFVNGVGSCVDGGFAAI
jgi:Enoyl-(Acyl carrier protein) reductase